VHLRLNVAEAAIPGPPNPAGDGGWLIAPYSNRQAIANALSNKTYIGIDFGTATSVVSLIARDDLGRINCETLSIDQPDEYGGVISHHLVNSVLAWKDGRLLFGRDAYRLRQRLFEGRNIFSSFKMRLGIDIGPTYPETALKRSDGHAIAIENANDAAREFFKCLFKAIKEAIRSRGLPQDMCFAVSVPASFEANQRRDLIEDMTAAGLPVSGSCLIDEPNAAFLSFLRQSAYSGGESPFMERLRRNRSNILVYDFGAGTCDVSILEVGITDDRVPRSRNRAISRFTALGGDDFDRAIASQALLPQIIAAAPGFDPELRDIEERLLPRLQPTAERLKVAAIEWLSGRNIATLDQVRAQQQEFTDNPAPGFKIRGHDLCLNNPRLSLAQLADIMESFMAEYDPDVSGKHVYAPVDDALKKSGLRAEDLNAVLFIGGSAANPLVRTAVMENLPPTVEAIIPNDLRSHVSLGAALHCLGFHAFGLDLICPITSEPVSVITRGGRQEIIIPPSSEVPTLEPLQARCRVDRPGQRIVELPICVGNKNKLLGVLRIEAPTPEGFGQDEEVYVRAGITHDKLLKVEARVGDQTVQASLLNPLDNRELSPAEKSMLKAKQKFNEALLQYGSNPPKRTVLEYGRAALEAEAFETAADMFVAVERLDRTENHAVNICYAYSQAGKEKRAEEWAKRAYQRQKSEITAYNLSIRKTGPSKEALLREALAFNPRYTPALENLGTTLTARGSVEGRAMLKECAGLLEPKLRAREITKNECRCLARVAEKIGETSLAAAAKAELERLNEAAGGPPPPYDDGNLAAPIDREALPERF
jgi:molecular chaperone DnaK (HSP70)